MSSCDEFDTVDCSSLDQSSCGEFDDYCDEFDTVDCCECGERFSYADSIGCCTDYKGNALTSHDIDFLCPECKEDYNELFEYYDGRDTKPCMDCENYICDKHAAEFESDIVNRYGADKTNIGLYMVDGKEYVCMQNIDGNLYMEHVLCYECKFRRRLEKIITNNGSIKNFKLGSLKNIAIDYIQENDIDDSNMPKLLMCPNSKEKQTRKAQQFASKSK